MTPAPPPVRRRPLPLDCSRLDLSGAGAATVVRRAERLRVCFAVADSVVETLEGPVRCQRGDAIVSGRHGDRWPVQRRRFRQTYVVLGTDRLASGRACRKRPLVALALRMGRTFAVAVGHKRDRIVGRRGDWLLQYGDGGHGVVADRIFRKTYR